MEAGFFCVKCCYVTYNKQTFQRHLARKTPCDKNNVKKIPMKQSINENHIKINENRIKINENHIKINKNHTDINENHTDIDNMLEKTCNLCGKEFKNVNSCRSHQSQKTCLKIKQNPRECPCCLKIFKNPNSCRSHKIRNSCIPAAVPVVEQQAITYTNIQNQTINNTTIDNSTVINNNINIVMNGYGNENIDYIKEDTEALTRAITSGQLGIQETIERMYFNPEHPENRTVQISNVSKNDCKVYNAETDKWDYKPVRKVIYELTFNATQPLNNHYIDEMKYGKNGIDNQFEKIKRSLMTSDSRPENKRRVGSAEDKRLLRNIEKDTLCTMLNNRK